MFTQADIRNISNAIETREALSQVRDRDRIGVAQTTRAEGPRYQMELSSQKLPIYDQNGNVFLKPLMNKDRALTIPKNIEQGSIVEYQDQMTGEYYYGKVTKSSKKGQVQVENMSQNDVNDELAINSKTKVYSLGTNDVSHHKGSGIMSTLMSMLDPSENIVFKLMTLLLVGNIFESESVTDIFMAVYLRVIALAISIVVVVVITSTLFG